MNKDFRTNPTQLPSYKELSDILLHEAHRTIPKEKEHIHYVDFVTIMQLLDVYEISTRFFKDDIRFEDLQNADLFAEISLMFDSLVDGILLTKDDPAKQTLFNNLYDYLSESDELEQADLIFVFGAKKIFRIEKAVNLYKKGYAPKIVISGKCPFYQLDKFEVSEAETLEKYALKHGVPKEDIILEKESITVPDNVKRSLNLLEERSIPHKSIILVNSPFSQRRGWSHFSKMSKRGTKLIRSNTDTVSEQYSRDGWYQSEAGAKVIVKEFFGL